MPSDGSRTFRVQARVHLSAEEHAQLDYIIERSGATLEDVVHHAMSTYLRAALRLELRSFLDELAEDRARSERDRDK